VRLGGLIGCAGDAYRPTEGLTRDEAARFHLAQTTALAAAGADFLFAATLPNVEEACGIALAMAGCHIPYVLSFVLKRGGALLDGTPLHEAVAAIDSVVDPRPLFYMVNCMHPSVCEAAFVGETSRSRRVTKWVIGLQANASDKSPEELEGLAQLEADPPEVLADAMLRLHRRFGTKILGGCCGTDDRHIEQIARRAKDCARSIP
jgi:homocysteine S-methyltransferase